MNAARSDATLSARTRDGLVKALGRGVWITVATARSASGARHVLEGVPLQLPIIECNGAYVTDLASGRRAHVHAMDLDLARTVLDVFSADGKSPFTLINSAQGERLCLASSERRHDLVSRREGRKERSAFAGF